MRISLLYIITFFTAACVTIVFTFQPDSFVTANLVPVTHHLTTLPAPVRNMMDMLMKYNSKVVPLSDEGITDVDIYRNEFCTKQSPWSFTT